MAQSIILKRSATSGKVPTTSSLSVGELAVNTYDGKIFLNRSGSSQSIQEIITTNVTNTGSITLTQTGSFGELVVTQDTNLRRDLYVVRDIITNGNVDISGSITGSSLLVENNANVNGDLTVLGSVNARQFNIGVISSSILYTSGSNKFGDTTDDTHEFTGSISVSGSLLVNGVAVSTGSSGAGGAGVFDFNLDPSAGTIGYISDTNSNYTLQANATSIQMLGGATSFATITSQSANFTIPIVAPISATNGVISGSSQLTSSYDSRYILSGSISQTTWDNIENKPNGIVSGSSQLTSSYDSRYVLSGSITQTTWDNIASKPDGIVSGSSQIIGILSSLNSYTSSQDTKNSTLATYTGSIDTKFTTLATTTASLNSAVTNLNTYTSSFAASSVTLTNKTISGASNTLSNIANASLTNSSITIAGTSTALGGTITAEQIRTAIGTIVTGSAQIAIASTSGFGTYINQAVLTSSSPSFVSVTETSSERYKENIITLDGSLNKVLNLRGVSYNRKETNKKEIGLIAEEVENIIPEIITYNDNNQPDSISYGRLSALLIEAMKEQQLQIEELKAEIQLLKNK